MTQEELRGYARRLEATGVQPACLTKDPNFVGTRIVLTPVPWEQALIRLMAASGYTIVDSSAQQSRPPLRLIED